MKISQGSDDSVTSWALVVLVLHAVRYSAQFAKCAAYFEIVHVQYTPCLKKTAKLFLSELHQILTDFENFWLKHGKEAKIMRGVLIFHLT